MAKRSTCINLSEEAYKILENYSKKLGLSKSKTIELMLKGLIPQPERKHIELPLKD